MRGRPRPHRLWPLAALALLGACGRTEERATTTTGEEVVVIDATGSRRALPGPATRIVSLVPSATETLHALGRSEAIVGRTDYDLEPWIADRPSVGGGIGPNLEALVALRPDLVVRFAGEQDPRTPSRLDELGITHLAVRPDGIDDLYASIRLLGRVTGAEVAADSLIRSVRAGLGRVEEAVAGLPRLRVAYILGGTPPWVSGPGTYIDEVMAVAGGDNVFSDLPSLYASVSPEELRARRIDVVLTPSLADFDASLAPDARIEEIGDALEIPGPGVVDAAARVAELLHGVAVSGATGR
jgi:cobalamin transport system substrate-binding protein